jgi:hypothetical protein
LNERIDIKVTKLVTTSLVCIDPSDAIGKMVVTPVVVGKLISAERPHFALAKADNKDAFNHYWEAYRQQFKRGTSLARLMQRGSSV